MLNLDDIHIVQIILPGTFPAKIRWEILYTQPKDSGQCPSGPGDPFKAVEQKLSGLLHQIIFGPNISRKDMTQHFLKIQNIVLKFYPVSYQILDYSWENLSK